MLSLVELIKGRYSPLQRRLGMGVFGSLVMLVGLRVSLIHWEKHHCVFS